MKTAVISSAAPAAALDTLYRFADRVITLPPHPALPAPVASHADMIFCAVDKTVFFDKIYFEKYPDTVGAICSSGDYELTVTEPLGASYPEDVKLNVLVADGFAVGRRASASDDVVSDLESAGRRFINVSQGYAACSCLAYGGLIITADRGIAKALSGVCDTLTISPEGISLPPYGAGFIGGASGVDGDTVYFTGDISVHPDGARIVESLSSRGAKCVSLCDGGLFDVGGIKFIEH